MIDAIDEELEIRQMFLEEAQEYVDAMDDGLVGLDPRSPTFKAQMDMILRAAHSLKGAAGIMQFHELSATAHRLEDSLKIIKSNQPDLDISTERLLLNAVGVLREIIAINRQGRDIDRPWLESYDMTVFMPLETYLSTAESHTSEDIPEPEIDIAALMFEQEIDEMLGNLEAKIATSLDIFTLKTELQTLASELADLGEMLELPNFVELNQAIAQQIELASPDLVRELAISALDVWRRSQALVIEGCKSDISSEFEFDRQDTLERQAIARYEDSLDISLELLDDLTELTTGNQLEPLVADELEDDLRFLDQKLDLNEDYEEVDDNFQQALSVTTEVELNDLFGDRELTSQLTAEKFLDHKIIDFSNFSDDFLEDSLVDNPFKEISEVETILELNPFTDVWDGSDISEIFDSSNNFLEEQDIFSMDSNTELLLELPLTDRFKVDESEELVSLVNELVDEPVADFKEVEELFGNDSAKMELPLINEHIDESVAAIYDDQSPKPSTVDISAVSNRDTIGEFFKNFFNSLPPTPEVINTAAKTSSKETVDDLFDSFLEDSLAQNLSQWQQDELISTQAIAEELSIDKLSINKIDSLEVTADLFDGFGEIIEITRDREVNISDNTFSDLDISENVRKNVEDDLFNNDFDSIKNSDLGKNLSQYVKKSTSSPASFQLPDTLEELEEDLETNGDLPEIPSRVSDLVTAYVKDTSIRLPISRLEQLHDLSGEMIFGHNSLDGQVKQLRQLLNSLNTRIHVLEEANSQISTVYDRMTIEAAVKSRNVMNLKQIDGFDVLELDSYSELHSLSQSVSEAIVQLQEVVEDVDISLHETEQNTNSLTSNFRQLQTAIKETKMRPLKDIVGRFPRVIRSLGLQYDKQVEVVLNGADLLVEQTIVDVINDPLNHLLRNAFDHGIEAKQTRIKRGKNPKGKIEITAIQKERNILITLSDDGGGIDPQKIKAKIERSPGDLGLTSAQVASMDNNQLIQLIFEPGFTTTESVTSLSGRGVGMDVVRTNLKQIGAEIHTETQLGVGTTFTIAIPFTLSTLRIALIEIDRMILGIPTDCIQAVIPDLDFTNDPAYQTAPVLYQDELVSVFPLSNHLQLNCHSSDRHLEDKPLAATKSILIINHAQSLRAIYVNGCWGEQEITLRQPTGKTPMPKIFIGCAIAANGQSVPILDMQVLAQNQSKISSAATITSSLFQKTHQITSQNNAKISQSTILVVDDSIAVRRYLALLLKKAGFKVEQAKDGEEAIAKLLNAPVSVDIVLSDVEMPRLDGYGLLTLIKSDRALQHLPVVMLTSRSGDKHRELAVNLGAAQYFTKPFIEQELIQSLTDLALKVNCEN